MDFPGRSVGKESACNARDSPGEGIGYSLQDSGLENSMDCIVHLGSQRVAHDGATFTHSLTHGVLMLEGGVENLQ